MKPPAIHSFSCRVSLKQDSTPGWPCGCLYTAKALCRGICLSDSRVRPEICRIHPGHREPPGLLGVSLPLHPNEARCPKPVWESPVDPQHVPGHLYAEVSAGGVTVPWQSPLQNGVPGPLTSPASPHPNKCLELFLAGAASAWPRNDLPGLFLTHRTGNISGFKPS